MDLNIRDNDGINNARELLSPTQYLLPGFMSGSGDFVNRVIMEIENSILKPLEDIENSSEGILEGLAENMNIEKPRIMTTINPINECLEYIDKDQQCQLIMGKYFADESVILINYKFDMNTLLHLFAHHVHAIEMGRTKYVRVRKLEELRLPWQLRPTEIMAMHRTAHLVRILSPRAWRIYNEEIKPRIRDIEEKISNVRLTVSYLEKQVEHTFNEKRHI
ncbi:hypothetical protein [Vulcanisaeta souniana]|uniref:Uncharacterized protein n=1 Tax=Vulcanisaeta souniana JCM 11219 TaxID=1293586 RepID=A0A830E7P3_9CREN|nr:hypothetical protein [Vulcanisaeta souniana]BDR91636.1 hypothetical protein Vsou_07290 [Vulcanisaeta souniana JCM 11219]GGI71711.1 hypothetical protein GCM10007112_05640 [Vulcanisaeta souniana JCM 11219]